MSLRGRFIAYLAVLHLLLAVTAVYLLRESRLWLFAVEAVFVLSLVTGIHLVRRTSRSLHLAAEGARLIREREFTSRLREVGEPTVDALVSVYNQMADHLREERTKLQEQQQFLASLVQDSPAGILILDFDGRVASINPAAERLLGSPAAQLLGRRPADLVDGGTGSGDDDTQFPIPGGLLQVVAALPPGRAQVVGSSGARRVRCHHGTFVDRGFTRSFYLLEELTEELRQSERAAYEKLIRVMSHEVNNSVGASNSLLHSSLTYARELPLESREDFEQAIRVVIARTSQLNEFMQRFADVFRLPAPLLQPHRLIDLVEPIVRLQQARPEAEGIQWTWEVADRDLIVQVDRGQFEQAVLNVVKNAVEAAGPGGRVNLRISGPPARPTLAIEDNGPGPSPEARANLFTPFFSTKPHGHGIGLTLVQEILAAHGCAFTLDREEGWTRFRITMRDAEAGVRSG